MLSGCSFVSAQLVEIGKLETYIRSTACVLFFLSKGYFESRSAQGGRASNRRTLSDGVPPVHSAT